MGLPLTIGARIARAGAMLIPVALFLAFFHPAILDPTNFGWLLRQPDNGENALGLHAWLNDPTTHGTLRTTLLGAPEGVALLFTDSNPLLAILVAPVSGMLGRDVQWVGPWMLACLILQAGFAHALVKPFAPDRIASWYGVALLLLLPALWARYVHANLFAHWLLLWAFWVFVDPRRAGDARWWAALLCVAALVHDYLLVMVAAIWASAMLERFAAVPERRGWLAIGALLTLAAVAVVISCLGITADVTSTRTYGGFAMPLDALWNPSNASYSNLLPATPQRPHRAFEGFQYLGAGLLALVAAAPFLVGRTVPAPPIASLHRRLLWLVPAGIVLTLLAVSHQVDWSGRTLVTLPLPPAAIALLDPVRASGRLFWPVAYALVFFAVTAACRLSPDRARLMLGGAVLLQLADLTGMMAAIRHVTAEAPAHAPWHRTADPRWGPTIAAARDVAFAPPDPTIALDLYQEVAWRAVDAGIPVRVVYAARDARATTVRLAAEQADFVAGRLVADRLYVLFPQAVVPPGAARRLAVFDGVRVLLPISSRR